MLVAYALVRLGFGILLTSSLNNEGENVSRDEYLRHPSPSDECMLLTVQEKDDAAKFHINGRCKEGGSKE